MPLALKISERANVTDELEQRLSPSDDVTGQRVGNEMVLVHLVTNRIYELNSTGARVWELLSQKMDRTEIERRMLQEYDVAEQDLAEELDSLFTSLRTERLLVNRRD